MLYNVRYNWKVSGKFRRFNSTIGWLLVQLVEIRFCRIVTSKIRQRDVASSEIRIIKTRNWQRDTHHRHTEHADTRT